MCLLPLLLPACLPARLQAIGNGELYEQHAELIKVRKQLREEDMVRTHTVLGSVCWAVLV